MNRVAFAILASLFLWSVAASAHDVPDNVKIAVFLKPENGRMMILVRMPANALIDFLFPMRPDGPWLDLSASQDVAAQAAKVWIAGMLSLYEDGRAVPRPDVLAVRISHVNDPFFKTFEGALDHVNGDRLPLEVLVNQDEIAVDALLQTPIKSVKSNFSFEPRFARVGVVVDTTLTFLPPGDGLRQFQYEGDPETFELNPGLEHTMARFVQTGFVHYFSQTDYLLFVLCIALIFRSFRALLPFAVALACAQFFAFIASLEVMPSAPWIPVFCGILIAAATVYMGIEAILGGDGKRVSLAVTAGLICGSGFWFGLQPSIQFGGVHVLASGLGFNLGVVMSELAALSLLVAIVKILLRLSQAPRAAVIIAAAIAIHISWRRMLDRTEALTLVSLNFPAVNPATLTAIGATVIAALSGSAYYLRRRHRTGPVRAT